MLPNVSVFIKLFLHVGLRIRNVFLQHEKVHPVFVLRKLAFIQRWKEKEKIDDR